MLGRTAPQFRAVLFSRFLCVEHFRLCVWRSNGGFRIWLFHLGSAAASRIEHRFCGRLNHFNFAATVRINTTIRLTFRYNHDALSSGDNRDITVTQPVEHRNWGQQFAWDRNRGMPYASSRCFRSARNVLRAPIRPTPLLNTACHFETQNLTWPQRSVSECSLPPIEQIAAHSL
jgi:hypothetical protein